MVIYDFLSGDFWGIWVTLNCLRLRFLSEWISGCMAVVRLECVSVCILYEALEWPIEVILAVAYLRLRMIHWP